MRRRFEYRTEHDKIKPDFLGAAQLLGRKLCDSDRALTELITGEVDRIAKLVDQMQSLSRRGQEPRV
ncbi:MAG: hypothetical protein NT115_02280, partial [Proteobacteria bacterium]|nr:hypothetical protein [Pseudomonadota bacterium]